jgi:hypothetical protein
MLRQTRHGQACPGHPRLSWLLAVKTWMPGTRPGMTKKDAFSQSEKRRDDDRN